MSKSSDHGGEPQQSSASPPPTTTTNEQLQQQQSPPSDDPSKHNVNSNDEDDEGMVAGHPATTESALLYETEVKEQDRWLPIANVARIMKTALPDNAKIAKEAKECMQECVSEFISFITSEASEKCQHEKRKTVNGEDILFAMTSLGFENYSEALKVYLSRYRESNMSRNENHQARPTTAEGLQAPRPDEDAASAGLAPGADVVAPPPTMLAGPPDAAVPHGHAPSDAHAQAQPGFEYPVPVTNGTAHPAGY